MNCMTPKETQCLNPKCGKDLVEGESMMECRGCRGWAHEGCTGLSKATYSTLQKGGNACQWFCMHCRDCEDKIVPGVQEALKGIHAMLIELNNRMSKFEGACSEEAIDKKIEQAVERKMKEMIGEKEEQEKRKLNIVISNIPESRAETAGERKEEDLKAVRAKIDELGFDGALGKEVVDPVRLGRFTIGQRPRMLRVTAKTEDAKKYIMQNASSIKQTETDNKKKIWFNHDLTEKERREDRELREELKRRRLAGETDLIIRRKQIVKKFRSENGEDAANATGKASARPNAEAAAGPQEDTFEDASMH